MISYIIIIIIISSSSSSSSPRSRSSRSSRSSRFIIVAFSPTADRSEDGRHAYTSAYTYEYAQSTY